MMIDYHVWDDWPDGDPTWLKALVSSLYRGERRVETTLPLGCAVQEILEWVELASGPEAWAKAANRESLIRDYHQSADALGASLSTLLKTSTKTLSSALSSLNQNKNNKDKHGNVILKRPPGSRTDPAWTGVENACQNVLAELVTDAAVNASWDDLVSIVQSPMVQRGEHRWAADVLFEQLRLRQCDAKAIFREIVNMLAYGRSANDFPFTENTLSVADRLDAAGAIALTTPPEEEVVVWLGYAGGRVDYVVAGSVTFMDAHRYGPNADADRHDFIGKDELAELRRASMFSVAERVDQLSDVDLLARVELGITPVSGAIERAEAMVDALLSISVHWSGGARPFRTQSAVFHNGQWRESRRRPRQTALTDDYHGFNLTHTAITECAPALGAVLATRDLPRYLTAAVEMQTAADLPSSREQMFRTSLDVDIRGVIPLEDRVVQHVAAYAGFTPNELFERLTHRWPHSRWESDVYRATSLSLLGDGPNHTRILQLRGQFYAPNAPKPWLVFVADNAKELTSLCRVESESSWVERILCSVSDPVEYHALIKEYEAEAGIISSRRARVRNALVHGNPASMEVVSTIADISSYSSSYALRVGLESFTTGDTVAAILDREQAEQDSLRAEVSVADYWHNQAAKAAQLAVTRAASTT